MKRITTIFIGILGVAFTSCSTNSIKEDKMEVFLRQMEQLRQKLDSIKNDSLKSEMTKYAYFVSMYEQNGLERDIVPQSTKYKLDTCSILNDYSSFEELTDNFIKGIYLTRSGYSGGEVTLHPVEPFIYPFIVNYNWVEVILNNGVKIGVRNTNIDSFSFSHNKDSIQAFQHKRFNPTLVHVFSPSAEPKLLPSVLKGKIEAIIPSAVNRFHFNKKDIGTTKTIEGITIKLVDMVNNHADVEIETPEGFYCGVDACDQFRWIKISAKDKTNKYLSSHTGSTGSFFDKQMFEGVYPKLLSHVEFTDEFISGFLEECKKKEEEYHKIYNSREKNKRFQWFAFRGIVEDVYVDVYDFTKPVIIQKDTSLTVLDRSIRYTRESMPVLPKNATVYDGELKKIFESGCELSESNLNAQITISQGKTQLPSHKKSLVELICSESMSDKIHGGYTRFEKLKNIQFYDKHDNLIKLSPDSIGYENYFKPNWLVDFSGGRIEYHPERFPGAPAYVKGTVAINIFAIEKQEFPVDNLPEGISIVDNAILIESSSKLGSLKLYVKNATDRYLKLIGDFYIQEDKLKNEPPATAYYFYGKPETIEFYKASVTKQVDYPFEVKLD